MLEARWNTTRRQLSNQKKTKSTTTKTKTITIPIAAPTFNSRARTPSAYRLIGVAMARDTVVMARTS